MKLKPQILLSNALRTLACLALAFSAQALWAQGAYRCDDNGKTVYQAAPCAGGKAVDAAVKPTADQKGMAETNAAQERADAKRMAYQRSAREAKLRSERERTGINREEKFRSVSGMKPEEATAMDKRQNPDIKKDKKRKVAHKPKPPKKTKLVADTK